MIHFYCLVVEAGFYSDVVECRILNPAYRVRSLIGENVIWIFSPFLLQNNNPEFNINLCSFVIE